MQNPTPHNEKKTGRRQGIARILTTISHASTPFITTFLLIHLAAPVLANVGGTSAASRTMLLGREYYQTDFGETYLVLGPIVLHTLAGLSKRLLLSSPDLKIKDSESDMPILTSSKPTSTPTPTSPTPSSFRPFLKTALSTTGYATAFFFLPIHFLIHREYPTTTTTTTTIGPSSLDYEYVKFGLQTWPVRSWVLYTGLASFAALHIADGLTIIWDTWLRNYWGRFLTRKTRRVFMLGGVVVPVLLGLVVMAREPPMVMSFVASHYKAAYMESWIFQV